ncbi:MAG TPA: phosphate ABC transporter permease PstA [Candidatus Limnocylindria bacterium]|jgi:phosphate transport system permease protein|nr:phosphate ABC transporter permease PstA [Candidatus Limnocylindria bacterium]
MSGKFARQRQDWGSKLGEWSTGAATLLILAILAVILGSALINGIPNVSLRLLLSSSSSDMFEVSKAGLLPLLVGTVARVFLMTLFVLPVGVITAVYLTEYARRTSILTKLIQTAVNNLAGVPSIVFGLFGLGFFIGFIGRNMDYLLGHSESEWGKPALLWASLTLAVMTLPVVIVATEEALRAIPPGLREASLALGATKLQTIIRVVLPNALPGILTGAILAVSRAAGEVAPILFTGAAYYMRDMPHALNDQFMDLAYHTYILSTQSPNIDKTRPLLFAVVLVLLGLTFSLNIVAVLVRSRVRRKLRSGH